MSNPSSILVLGATGYVGGMLARHFLAQGYIVSGIARTPTARQGLADAGISPVHGDLEHDIAPILGAALSVDIVVYAAQVTFAAEPVVLRQLTQTLAGSGKTLMFLSGTSVFMQLTGGQWSPQSFAEDDPFTPLPIIEPRLETERIVRAAAGPGLRTMVIRPPVIWGPGDNGPVASVYRSVAKTGAACYVDPGLAVYSHVHSADLARLFSLALERGQVGRLYHATAGEIPYRLIAEAVARDLDVPSRGLSMDEANEVFGPFGAMLQAATSRSRDARTRAELGWAPEHHNMLSQIGEPRLRALAVTAPA